MNREPGATGSGGSLGEGSGSGSGGGDGASVLERYLQDEHARCPVCEYDLFKTAGACCPECGSPIQLGVVSTHARPGPWLLAVISFALALGFDGVIVLLMFVPMIGQGVPAFSAAPQFWVLYLMMWMLTAVSATGLVIMLRSKRRWQTRRPKTQWRRAWAVFLSVGFGHAAIAGGVVAMLAL